MFLKKSLLFMTALALLMFAGQASAQVSLSLGEGGSSTVSGAGTEIAVDVSQMGVTASVRAIEIVFDIDTSVITLTDGGPFILSKGNTATLLFLTPAPVPASASFTFTTATDVTGVEFSIGISSISLDNVPLSVPLPGAISFNGLEAALTSDGEINEAGELSVDVAVPGLAQATTGAEVMFVVDPAGSASIKGVTPADGLGEPPTGGVSGMSVTLIGIPAVALEGGSFASVTFAVDPDAEDFTIGIASLTVFKADGMKRAVAGGDPLMVSVGPRPGLETKSTEVEFGYGDMGSATVTAVNFDADAVIHFSYAATTDFQAMEDGNSLTITTDAPGTVTVTATAGDVSRSITITFKNPPPYLMASEGGDVIIPEGGEKSVTVTAVGLEGVITYMIKKTSGTAAVSSDSDGDMVTLTASGEGSAMVSVTASAGGVTTEAVDILFRAMPTVGGPDETVSVPQATVPSATAMVVATGFPEGAEITFTVDPASHPNLTTSADGNVLTLTATGTVTVSVTASGAGVTTSAVEVSFEQALPAAPSSVVVEDNPGDNGHYVMVSFANSANHADVSQYRIYREVMVTTTLDADGNVVTTDTPMAEWMSWAVVDAMDNDEAGMTRAVVPVTDNKATRAGALLLKRVRSRARK